MRKPEKINGKEVHDSTAEFVQSWRGPFHLAKVMVIFAIWAALIYVCITTDTAAGFIAAISDTVFKTTGHPQAALAVTVMVTAWALTIWSRKYEKSGHFEIFLRFTLIFSPVFLGAALFTSLGPKGYVIGILGGYAFIFAASVFAEVLDSLIRNGFPRFPSNTACPHCRRTVKPPADYFDKYIWGISYPPVSCKCGITYTRKPAKGLRAARIYRMNGNGVSVPYLRWAPFRGWIADNENPEPDDSRAEVI